MRRMEEAWREACGDLIATLLMIQFCLLGLALAFCGVMKLLHYIGWVGQV